LQKNTPNTKKERFESVKDKKKYLKMIKEKAQLLEQKMIMDEFYKIYDRNIISMMFFMIFLGNIMCNVDHGTLPGCS
jgi:hypothetical protein